LCYETFASINDREDHTAPKFESSINLIGLSTN
jgi:hypothetical protein